MDGNYLLNRMNMLNRPAPNVILQNNAAGPVAARRPICAQPAFGPRDPGQGRARTSRGRRQRLQPPRAVF